MIAAIYLHKLLYDGGLMASCRKCMLIMAEQAELIAGAVIVMLSL